MDIKINQIRDTAFNILARREHSRQELQQKLSRKYPDHGNLIYDLLAQLESENVQNDKRFAASYLRRALSKRHGKNRISRELKQKGIKTDDIAWAFESEDQVDWFELAKECKQVKFGTEIATDYKEKAKQFRYLQYRGFGFDEINYAVQEQD